jgi:hypothetical protein
MIGLPGFQSVKVWVPKKYCLMISGFVSASYTLSREASIGVLILLTISVFILLFRFFPKKPCHDARIFLFPICFPDQKRYSSITAAKWQPMVPRQ